MNQCIFSADRLYRYVLRRQCSSAVSESPRRIAWIGLNPSTADEVTVDRTLATVCRYSKKWGFSEVIMLNLFAFRATDPRNLKRAEDPIGPDNDRHLLTEVGGAERVIACWGDHGRFRGRDEEVSNLLRGNGVAFECLQRNKSGVPRHPLYLKARIKAEPYRERTEKNE